MTGPSAGLSISYRASRENLSLTPFLDTDSPRYRGFLFFLPSPERKVPVESISARSSRQDPRLADWRRCRLTI